MTVEVGAKFYSGLGNVEEGDAWVPYNGFGSVGTGWVHSFTERLFEVEGSSAQLITGGSTSSTQLRHMDWNNPYNNPAAYYQDNGNGKWVAPAWAGGEIELYTGTDYPDAYYRLTFKNGRKHYFNQSGQIVARANDSDKLAIQFKYDQTNLVSDPVTGQTEPALDQVIDARGMVLDVEMGSDGFISSVLPPSGVSASNGDGYVYIRDADDNLIEVRYPSRPVLDHVGTTASPVAAATTMRTSRFFTYADPAGLGVPTSLAQIIHNDGTTILQEFTYEADSLGVPKVRSATETADTLFNPPGTSTPGSGMRRWHYREGSYANGPDYVDVVTPRGYVRRYELDTYGRVVSLNQGIDPFLGQQLYSDIGPPAWDAVKRFVVPSYETYRYEFERDVNCPECGRILQVKEPADPRRSEPTGGTAHIAAGGTQTSFTYDAAWNLTRVRIYDPMTGEALNWYWEYNADNQIRVFADPRAVTEDINGDPVVDYQFAYTTTYTDDPVLPDGTTLTGGSLATTYNQAGSIRPTATVWKRYRDNRGRVVRTEWPSTTADASVPEVEEWVYHPDDPAQLGPNQLHERGMVKLYRGSINTSDNSAVTTELVHNLDGRVISGKMASTGPSGEIEASTHEWNAEGMMTAWQGPVHGAQGVSQQHRVERYYNSDGLLSKSRYRYYADPDSSDYEWVERDYFYTAQNHVWVSEWDIEPGVAGGPKRRARRKLLINGAGQVYGEHSPDYATGATDPVLSKSLLDEVGRPHISCDALQQVGPLVYATFYGYSPDGKLETVLGDTADESYLTVFGYDGFDRQVEAGGDTSSFLLPSQAYDYAKEELDPLGRPTKIENFVDGKLLEEVNLEYADWHISPTKVTRKGFKEVNGVTTALHEIETTASYSHKGLTLSMSVDGTPYTSIDYEQWGPIKSIADPRGNKTEFFYEPNKRRLSSEKTTSVNAETGGTLVVEREFERDLIGRVNEVRIKGSGVNDIVETFGYDTHSDLVSHVDGEGIESTMVRGFDGRILSSTTNVGGGSNSSTHNYSYTPMGRVESVEDNRGNIVNWTYDERMRLESEQVPAPFGATATTGWNYGYYPGASRLQSVTTPTGKFIKLEYDRRMFVSKRSVFEDSSESNLLEEYVYTRTPSGHIHEVIWNDHSGTSVVTKSVEFERDSSGNVLSEKATGKPKVVYGRDDLRHVDSISIDHTLMPQYLDSAVHTFVRDSGNRVAQVQTNRQGGGLLTVSDAKYLGPGHSIAALRCADSALTTTFSRNGFGLMEGIETEFTGAGSSLVDLEYQWNGRWLLDFEKRLHEGGKGDAYGYDGLGRLQEFYRDSADPQGQVAGSTPAYSYKNTYHMDADYHRTSVERTDYGASGTVTSLYTTDSTRHHYDSFDEDDADGVPPRIRTQDADGNLTRDGDRYYIYDVQDRLIRVEDRPMGGVVAVVAEYEYDALGRRDVIRTGGKELSLLYAGPWLLEEWDTTNAASPVREATHFHLGTGLDDVSMSRRLDHADLDDDGDSTDYVDLYHSRNYLGSVVALILESGTVVESYSYDAYGLPTVKDKAAQVVASSVAPSGNRFMFTGREWQPEVGLYDYRARSYDPETGTFLQEDPLGLLDSINPVAYVLANPVVFNDPTGMFSVGEALSDVIDWMEANSDIIAIVMELSPLGDILDAISAVSGKDILGWIEAGFEGVMDDLGWWARGVAAASAGAGIVTGGAVKIFKLLKNYKSIARTIRESMARYGETAEAIGKRLKKKMEGPADSMTGECFLAGALVAMSCGAPQGIESVTVLDHVAVPQHGVLMSSPNVPEDLVVVKLEATRPDGSRLQASLIRSRENARAMEADGWFSTHGFDGEITSFSFEALKSAPDWCSGLVTGCFKYEYSGKLVLLDWSGSNSIWATPDHQMYQDSSSKWVSANALRLGDAVWVDSIVYNLEVLGSKSYVLIGGSDFVAHNSYGGSWPDAKPGETRVSRWMDENEYSKMKSTGTLQWSKEDRTYVTTFGAEKPRGGVGPVRVDFNIPSHRLDKGGREDWRIIVNTGTTPPINGIVRGN